MYATMKPKSACFVAGTQKDDVYANYDELRWNMKYMNAYKIILKATAIYMT